MKYIDVPTNSPTYTHMHIFSSGTNKYGCNNVSVVSVIDIYLQHGIMQSATL